MRRGLVHVLAWLLATGGAVTLSWWGVHTVMAGTAYDPPRALPVTVADATARGSAPPVSPTPRPAPSRNTPKDPAQSTPAAPPGPAASSSAPSPAPAASPSGRVKAYDTGGGRAVFDLGTTSATLVSATPATGWSMQIWKTETWIRVEFSKSTDRVSVFCAWHDGPPHVDVGTY
ncbi:hypothetical protein LK07_11940 [Streptomyces pluripotens]|uniref:Secreted protein n=1 Tax=Streptomyces pluripotens TaxID=1355015 RepID=A0A221NXA8_9ACTN|nr:hypothetical protein [Streptomyces pluripotens]ARP70374.1 hypothetical protein LK06_010820 [Streptomyces pluripotens]ASN24629.1 hypothetical protein LK07_11940 [Streptomyces pluripotens]